MRSATRATRYFAVQDAHPRRSHGPGGNNGKVEARQPVPVDLKRPKAVITGAVAAGQ
jgi:hypothetical protein